MIQRLALAALRRYIGGPARSWVFTSLAVLGMRAARSVLGRREVVDVTKVKRGQLVVIEHLDISHKAQMREMKAERKADRAATKAGKRAAKQQKAADKADKAAKRAQQSERAARRQWRRAGNLASEASAGG